MLRKYFISIFTLLCLNAFSQTDENLVLSRKISISFNNVTLPGALKQLNRQAKVRFSYNSSIIPRRERFTRNYQEVSLDKILEDLLTDTNLSYGVKNGVILINKLVYTNRQLRGRVLEDEGQSPLPFTHVFIDNSTVGTLTDTNGEFVIENIPERSFNVIVSYQGYKTEVLAYSYDEAASGEPIIIEMKLDDPKLLDGVTVKPRKTLRKERKLLQRFMEDFLGQGENAKKCRITNPDIFEVDNDFDVEGGYRVTSKGIVYIENRALGYSIKFDLEEFVFINGAQSTKGTAQFEELEPKSRKQNRRWEEARERAYNGSLSHFLNALIKDDLEGQGFLLNTVQFDSVTSEYYSTSLNGKSLDEVFSLVRIDNGDRYRLRSSSDIEVTYTNEYESSDYVKRFRSKSKNNTYKYTDRKSISRVNLGDNQSLNSHLYNVEISTLQLFQKSVILFNNWETIIEAPGGFLNEEDVRYLGWWNWGGVSNLLPFDFKPDNKEK